MTFLKSIMSVAMSNTATIQSPMLQSGIRAKRTPTRRDGIVVSVAQKASNTALGGPNTKNS